MRQTLMAGVVVLAVASAGVTLAGRPSDPPKPDAPPAAKADPKPAAEPKPDAKEVTFTTKPRLQRTFDLDIPAALEVVWSPTGEDVAVRGVKPPPKPDPQLGGFGGGGGVAFGHPGAPGNQVYICRLADQDNPIPWTQLEPLGRVAGHTPDGKQLVTDLRESGLVSGQHQLFYRPVDHPNLVERKVDLDPEPTAGYAFSADGKTFRTVSRSTVETKIGDDNFEPRSTQVEVREVSTETGRVVRVPLKLDGAYRSFGLAPNGKRLAVTDGDDRITVYDIDAGEKSWTKTPALGVVVLDGRSPVSVPVDPKAPIRMTFSPDGRLLFAAAGIGTPAVLDAATGEPRSPLDGVGMIQVNALEVSFSADGRLLAVSGDRIVKTEQAGRLPGARGGTVYQSGGRFLTVWDTTTGKVVKTWRGAAVVAFHPTQPVLAVLEKNGDQTRLGLWDFAAEGPK